MAPQMQPNNYFGTLLGGAADTLNNEKATPLMRLTFNVTHQAVNGEWAKLTDPVTRDVQLFLSDKAWPYSQPKLAALGFNGDFSEPVFDSDIISKGTMLECRHRRGTGQDQNMYEDWSLGGYGQREVKSPSQDELRKFNARWRQDAASQRPPQGAPTPPPQTEAVGAATGGADDIPFEQ